MKKTLLTLGLILIAVLAISICFNWFSEKDDQPLYRTCIPMRVVEDTEIRTWASEIGPYFDYLTEDTVIKVWKFSPSSDGRVWCAVEIEHENHEFGFVSMEHLDFIDAEYKFSETMKVTNKTKVYESNIYHSTVVTTLKVGQEMEVLEVLPMSDGKLWVSCNDTITGDYIGWIDFENLAQ